jgi:hypothetical protein
VNGPGSRTTQRQQLHAPSRENLIRAARLAVLDANRGYIEAAVVEQLALSRAEAPAREGFSRASSLAPEVRPSRGHHLDFGRGDRAREVAWQNLHLFAVGSRQLGQKLGKSSCSQSQPWKQKGPVSGAFRVAGAGFEPATSGL